MAILNTGCSISVVQADITGITTGYAAECFAVLAAAVDSATQDRCVTVPTSGSLPSLYPTQTIPQGQVVFVEDVGVPVIAASGKWIGFDQRTFRKDSPNYVLYSWGDNTSGPLGDGTTTARSSPGTTAGCGINWAKISSAGDISAGVKSDGTLWTWGTNLGGPLGDGTASNRSSPGTTAGGGTTWSDVSLGQYLYVAAIKTDGTLWTWGYNGTGQLGTGDTTSRSSPGTVAGGGTNWCLVSAGRYMTLGIKTDGTLWTWGGGNSGVLGDGTTTNRSSPGTVAGGGNTWCAASAGFINVSAIKTDGTLWTWGAGTYGALGDGTITGKSSPVTTSGGGTTWQKVSAGYRYSLAIKTDGTLWAWGFNSSGKLGDGTTTNRCSPVQIAGGGTTWCSVSAGTAHAAAVKTDGTLWTWGANTMGILGTGNTTSRSSPGTTAGGSTTCWVAASAAGRGYFIDGCHTLGIRIM